MRFAVLDGPMVEEEEGDVSDDIVSAVGAARAANPADRGKGVELFVNTLEYLEEVCLNEVKFMVFMTRECEVVSKKHSVQMVTNILKVCGRFGVPLRYPGFWELVRQDFDEVLKQHVTIKGPSSLLRPQFVFGLKDALDALVGYEHVRAVGGPDLVL